MNVIIPAFCDFQNRQDHEMKQAWFLNLQQKCNTHKVNEKHYFSWTSVAIVYGTCNAIICQHASYQAFMYLQLISVYFWHSLLSRGDRGAWPGELKKVPFQIYVCIKPKQKTKYIQFKNFKYKEIKYTKLGFENVRPILTGPVDKQKIFIPSGHISAVTVAVDRTT